VGGGAGGTECTRFSEPIEPRESGGGWATGGKDSRSQHTERMCALAHGARRHDPRRHLHPHIAVLANSINTPPHHTTIHHEHASLVHQPPQLIIIIYLSALTELSPCARGNLFLPSLPGRVRFQRQLAEEKAAHRRLANKTAEAAQGKEERDRLTVCGHRLPLLLTSLVTSLRLQTIPCGVNGFPPSFGGSLWVKTTTSAPPTRLDVVGRILF